MCGIHWKNRGTQKSIVVDPSHLTTKENFKVPVCPGSMPDLGLNQQRPHTFWVTPNTQYSTLKKINNTYYVCLITKKKMHDNKWKTGWKYII